MPWTTPKTWTDYAKLTASELNTHLRDNLAWIKAWPKHVIRYSKGSYYSITGTSFAALDTTNLRATITTSGGDVLLGMTGVAAHGTVGGQVCFDVSIDGGAAHFNGLGWGGGFVSMTGNGTSLAIPVSAAVLITGLSAASHTFDLMCRVNAGTGYLMCGDATGDYKDVPLHFWVKEL